MRTSGVDVHPQLMDALTQLETAVATIIKVSDPGQPWLAEDPLMIMEFARRLESLRRQLGAVDRHVVTACDSSGAAAALCQRSTAALLAATLQLSPSAAGRRVRAAHAIGMRHTMTGTPLDPVRPVLAAAVTIGAVSTENTDIVIRCLDTLAAITVHDHEHGAERLDAAEHDLTRHATIFGPDDLRACAAEIIDCYDPDGQPDRDHKAETLRTLRLIAHRDGGYSISGRLTGTLGAQLYALLSPLTRPRPTPPASADRASTHGTSTHGTSTDRANTDRAGTDRAGTVRTKPTNTAPTGTKPPKGNSTAESTTAATETEMPTPSEGWTRSTTPSPPATSTNATSTLSADRLPSSGSQDGGFITAGVATNAPDDPDEGAPETEPEGSSAIPTVSSRPGPGLIPRAEADARARATQTPAAVATRTGLSRHGLLDDRDHGQRWHDALEDLIDRVTRIISAITPTTWTDAGPDQPGQPGRPGQPGQPGQPDQPGEPLNTDTRAGSGDTSSGLIEAGGTPATVIITINEHDLHTRTGYGTSSDGVRIPTNDVILLTDQAEIWPTLVDPHGAVLNLGRARRIATRTQTLALIARDAGCTFPTCTHPPEWCQRHHILAWTDGGHTNLDNLTLVCGYHHRNFQQRGWTCTMINRLPHWSPPAWINPDQTPLLHHRLAHRDQHQS